MYTNLSERERGREGERESSWRKWWKARPRLQTSENTGRRFFPRMYTDVHGCRVGRRTDHVRSLGTATHFILKTTLIIYNFILKTTLIIYIFVNFKLDNCRSTIRLYSYRSSYVRAIAEATRLVTGACFFRRMVAGARCSAAIKRSLILKAAKPLVITLLKLAKRLTTTAVRRPPVQACEAAHKTGGAAYAGTFGAWQAPVQRRYGERRLRFPGITLRQRKGQWAKSWDDFAVVSCEL
jgi:hypothetical protein